MNPVAQLPAGLGHALEDGIADLGLPARPACVEPLLHYLGLLARWNRAYNLTAVTDPREMLPRHLLDSLSVVPHLQGERILDMGTGAGLPGIPLALWFPEREFHLLDANGKKIRFLFQVKTELGLGNVTLHHCRAESLADPRGFDAVLSRAVASLADLCRIGGPLLAPGGSLFAMKAEVSAAEFAGLPDPYTVASDIALQVPGITQPRRLLVIRPARDSGSHDGDSA